MQSRRNKFSCVLPPSPPFSLFRSQPLNPNAVLTRKNPMYPSSKALLCKRDPMLSSISQVEQLLSYKFRNPSLIAEALTHSSDVDHASYQRLEFVGDAALGLALSNYFYLTCPDLGPGPLSVLRAANISTEKLARVAVKYGFYDLVRRNSPKLDLMVEEFTLAVQRENEADLYGLPYGGSVIKAPKVLADIVESIAAAVYVDCAFNLEKLWTVFRGILEPIITAEDLDEQPITTLYEFCQKRGKSVDFKTWKKGNTNIINVFVDGDLLGIGSSEHLTIARLNAARHALEQLGNLGEGDVEMGNADDKSNNSKQMLNEICTKRRWPKPVYRIEEELGPGHDKKFICSVKVLTPTAALYEVGDPKPRVKDAENSAAENVLCKIDR